MRHLALLLLVLPLLARADAAAERSRIETERRQVEARFAGEEAQCRQRFEVTACVDGVKARRREALSVLRGQEQLLDDAERRRRATLRMRDIDAKRVQAESRPPAPLQPVPVLRRAAAASAPLATPQREQAPHHDEARAAAEAGQRASAAEQRQRLAADNRARIAERESKLDRSAKKSAPLPLPASSPAR